MLVTSLSRNACSDCEDSDVALDQGIAQSPSLGVNHDREIEVVRCYGLRRISMRLCRGIADVYVPVSDAISASLNRPG
jgi:hypothetical protein